MGFESSSEEKNTRAKGLKKSLITVKRSKESKGKVIKDTWELQKIIHVATLREKTGRKKNKRKGK